MATSADHETGRVLSPVRLAPGLGRPRLASWVGVLGGSCHRAVSPGARKSCAPWESLGPAPPAQSIDPFGSFIRARLSARRCQARAAPTERTLEAGEVSGLASDDDTRKSDSSVPQAVASAASEDLESPEASPKRALAGSPTPTHEARRGRPRPVVQRTGDRTRPGLRATRRGRGPHQQVWSEPLQARRTRRDTISRVRQLVSWGRIRPGIFPS